MSFEAVMSPQLGRKTKSHAGTKQSKPTQPKKIAPFWQPTVATLLPPTAHPVASLTPSLLETETNTLRKHVDALPDGRLKLALEAAVYPDGDGLDTDAAAAAAATKTPTLLVQLVVPGSPPASIRSIGALYV